MLRQEILLRKLWLKAWPGTASLIEPTNGSTPGFPDAFVSHKGLSGLIEFKVALPDHSVLLEASQRLWLLEREEDRPPVAIVALREDCFWTFSPWPQVTKGMPLQMDIPRDAIQLGWRGLTLPASLLEAAVVSWEE